MVAISMCVRAWAIAAAFGVSKADENAGFDIPGEPDDSISSPTYHVGDRVEIAWHMNFTECRLKLVHTPNDHTSTSEYIIGEPTADTSYLWTADTYGLNAADDDNPGFYFSVYMPEAEDASFISHNVFILPADASDSSSSTGSPSPTPTISSISTSTTPSTSTSSQPTSLAPTPTSQDPPRGANNDAGTTAGIAIGSVLGTLLVVGVVGGCAWRMFKRRRAQEKSAATQGSQATAQQYYHFHGGSYPPQDGWHTGSHQYSKAELANNEISELAGRHMAEPVELNGSRIA